MTNPLAKLTSYISNWTPVTIQERDSKGNLETASSKGRVWKIITTAEKGTSGNLYQAQGRLNALVRDLAYLTFAVPYKAATTVGHTVWAVKEGTQAAWKTFKNRNDAAFSKTEAFKPARNHAWHAVKDLGAAGVLFAAARYTPDVSGYNIPRIVAVVGGVILLAKTLYDPKRTREGINKFEKNWNIAPLSNQQVKGLSLCGKVAHFLGETYTLSHLLGIHLLGNIGDQTSAKENRFAVKEVKVEPKIVEKKAQ